jgi:predicted nucleic acid-binding protein
VILVDTSVWIDYLRGDSTSAVEALEGVFRDSVPFAITGVIYQEILQGADSSVSFRKLSEYFSTQRFLHPLDPIHSHAHAAELYRRCRRAGVTIRSTVDCLIAQVALEHDVILLHSDRDYVNMAGVITELRLFH